MSRTEKQSLGVKNFPFSSFGRNIYLLSGPEKGDFRTGSRFFGRFRSPQNSSHLWARSHSFHTPRAKKIPFHTLRAKRMTSACEKNHFITFVFKDPEKTPFSAPESRYIFRPKDEKGKFFTPRPCFSVRDIHFLTRTKRSRQFE